MRKEWICAAFFLAIVMICGCTSSPDDIGGKIVINGRFVNMEQANKFVDEKSYVQLIFLPPDMVVAGESDAAGRISYISSEPTAQINPDGSFSLIGKGLRPGRYFISVQKMKPAGGVLIINGKFRETFTNITKSVPLEKLRATVNSVVVDTDNSSAFILDVEQSEQKKEYNLHRLLICVGQ